MEGTSFFGDEHIDLFDEIYTGLKQQNELAVNIDFKGLTNETLILKVNMTGSESVVHEEG